MTLITLPRPAATEATSSCFAAPDAFRVLRAWPAWAARGRNQAATGFSLRRTDEGTLLLSSENLEAETIRAIGLHSHRRLTPVAGVEEPTGASAFYDPDTWARLRCVKALYDPQDVFRGNHHIPPAV